MQEILKRFKGDLVIWMIVILLSILSVLAVYSSTGSLAFRTRGGNTEFFLLKQFGIMASGLLLMYIAHLIKYTYYSRTFQIALYIAVPIMLLTLFLGSDYNSAKRGFDFDSLPSFQTTDFAKLTLIAYLARALTKRQDNLGDFRSVFLPVMVPVILICGLILPNNLSSALILFATSMILMFIGRVRVKHLLKLSGIATGAMIIFIVIVLSLPGEDQGRIWTWKHRIEAFLHGSDESVYQVEQAKIAIASGGLTGKMPGHSTQKNFLPHPYSDYIFALIIEEYGLIGGSIVVLLYLILFYRAVRIFIKVPRNFGAFLAIGLSLSLVFQAFINMGVAVNLLPVTGQTLPMVSMGGTSVWFTSISLGILLSVSREIKEGTIEESEKTNEYVTTPA